MADLILGGTGTVGGAVVRGLLEAGRKVRVLTRSADKAKALPSGATGVVGDLMDPATYGQIFSGGDLDGVFLLNALNPSELNEGLCALAEAKRAGAKRIVYLSVHDAEKAPHVPHFASKVAIESGIKASGIPYTLLRPNNFYQNDVWFLEAITKHGVYPQPMGGAGLSRVDVRDIAAAAVNALTKPGHENKSYALAGPDALTGEQTAALWAKALGRDVRYAGDDLVAWGEQQKAHLPAWLLYDFTLMYEFFQAKGLKASDAQLRETETAIGGPPRRYADYVAETAASLSGSGSVT
ncbi:MAG: NmrA family NAD(P)-binding protein [Candidatus Eisenbacteria bacterium]